MGGVGEIEYPWRRMMHENSIENWHEGGRNSIGGHRDLRVNGWGTRYVLQALDVFLERVGHEGLGLHAHVLVIEFQRVLLVDYVVTPRSRHGWDPRLRNAFAERQKDRSGRQQDDGGNAEHQSPRASDLKRTAYRGARELDKCKIEKNVYFRQ